MNYRPNTGYNDWDNIHEKQTLYIGNKYHGAATKEAWEIIDTLKDRQKAYPKMVKALTRIIHLIAYWGKKEKANNNNIFGNPGNFRYCSEDC